MSCPRGRCLSSRATRWLPGVGGFGGPADLQRASCGPCHLAVLGTLRCRGQHRTLNLTLSFK